MRKFGLLAAAAGLALSGSLAKADFIISDHRMPGPTIGTQTTEIVDFTVTNNSANSTGAGINSLDVALYSPQGMYVGVRSGHPDVFFAAAGSVNDSWIQDESGLVPGTDTPVGGLGNGNLGTSSGAVLTSGQNPTTTAGSPIANVVGAANQLVQGIAGTLFAAPVNPDASPLWFARAVVPTGATVQLLNPAGTNNAAILNPSRQFEQGSGIFSPGAGNFAATNNSFLNGPYTSVPEPTSLALVGIAGAGLLARRRRNA